MPKVIADAPNTEKCPEDDGEPASPTVEKMLSQDDSFFTELAGQLEEEERREETDSQADMFEDSGEEEEQEVVRRVTAEPIDWKKTETPVKAEMKASQDICSPPASLTPSLTSSLPASCLDVRARALEDLARRQYWSCSSLC